MNFVDFSKELGGCNGARARHLVRGSLRAWLVYLDVASPLLLLLTLISS